MGGGSRSSGKSTTTTTTTTEQKDQRVAASDSAIALGSGAIASGATVTINADEITPATAEAFSRVLQFAEANQAALLDVGGAALEAKQQQNDQLNKTMLYGLGGLGLLAILLKGGK